MPSMELDSASGASSKPHSKLVISPEKFRVIAYTCFGVLVGTGILLTKFFANMPEETVIHSVYGYDNICINFDYPPATYVVPTMWCVFLVPWVGYILTFWLRASIRLDEGKLSATAYYTMSGFSVFEVLCALYFIQVFVSKPHDHPDPIYGLTMHQHPFTIFIVSIFTMSFKSAWYFSSLGKLSSMQKFTAYSFIVLLFAMTVQKVTIEINAMAGGPLWVPSSETAMIVGSLADKLWTVLATVVPALVTYFVELKDADSFHVSLVLVPSTEYLDRLPASKSREVLA